MTPLDESTKPLTAACLLCESQAKLFCDNCSLCFACCNCDGYADDYDDEDEEDDDDTA